MDKSIPGRAKLALAVAVLAAAALMNGSLHASADQPRTDTLDINETSTVESLCGFPVVVHEEGTLRTSVFFDQDGQVTRITEHWQGVNTSITNPDNGQALSYHIAGQDGFTVDQNGGMTFFTKGLRGIITVPGSGAISGQAGNVTISISPTGDMEVRRSGFLREGDFSVACDYLQGP